VTAARGAPGLELRIAAAAAVEAVMHRRTALDEALGRTLARHPDLSERDRALLRLIVVTTLRRAGEIGEVLGRLLKRPLPETASRVLATLQVAAAQLLFLDTAPHAAIGLAVDAARAAKPDGERFAGLANAVLRRVAGEGRTMLAGLDAAVLNTPPWLMLRWTATYGAEEARSIARQHLETPPLDLSVKTDAAHWSERLGAALLPGGTLRLPVGGRIEALAGYAEGAWWVQDYAASLPVRLLGEVRGKRVADLCAAPGGKTAQLSAAGAAVTAIDSSVARLQRLTENLSRLGLAAETVAADVCTYHPQAPFDAVLLDAPCLATGTIRRHPDVPMLKREADLDQLTAIQRRLLEAAWAMLRPGGTLVFCTCSLEPEEGAEQIAAFLARHREASLLPVGPEEIGGGPHLIRGGCLRTLPSMSPAGPAVGGGIDGFFAGRVMKGTVDPA
jgi:16S rRNA (cytosine967-C5)-methyltransferase